MDQNNALTAKEQEVLIWIAAGKTMGEIASILEISPNTVGFHQKNIYRKLDVSNRVSAARKARSLGLTGPEDGVLTRKVKAAYDGFQDGTPIPLFDLLHPDVEWISEAPQDQFPHAGHTTGKDEAIGRILQISEIYPPQKLLPHNFVEDGKKVSVLLDVELLHLATGTVVAFDVAHFWTFEGDLVVRYQEVFNSSSMLQQIDEANPT